MKNYPRVTQILGATKSEKERERLAFWLQKYKGKEDVCQRGSNFHTAIQEYFNTSKVPEFTDKQLERWNCAVPILDVIKNDYFCLETEVWSDKYQYAGRLDCLAWEGDELILIDWKTSDRWKRKEWIEDYFLQGAAYSLAAFECKVAPKMPSEVRIYIFSPQKVQVFSRPLGFDLVLRWLERLNLFQSLQKSAC
jgi:genome maintenance exonuclease 1